MKPKQSPVMMQVVEKRKAGQYNRAKSWGGRIDNKTSRRKNKQNLKRDY